MAISEICKFEVKKEIDSCTSKGMSRNQAAKWLAGVFSEALGQKIKPDTIKKKDQRARKDLGTNVPSKSEDRQPARVDVFKSRATGTGGKRKMPVVQK